ncbi:MAG: hypothetical protein QG670_565 [Thermoproteota archaeon]|nr:hypothetical protein [Thermoproteota archaeon]
MSDTRSYFSYRYAVSGFIFTIIVFLVNLDLIPIILGLETTNLSTIITIVTFLSGPSIGFIIAQFWYDAFASFGIHRLFWIKGIEALKKTAVPEPKVFDTDLLSSKIDYWLYRKKKKEVDIFGKRAFDY